MIKLYGIPNCNKIRNTMKLFDEAGIAYEFINVRKTPVAPDKLRSVIAAVGTDALFNTKGTTYRRLNLDYKTMTADEKFEALLREQSMIKRPLIERSGTYHVGYDETAIRRFIA